MHLVKLEINVRGTNGSIECGGQAAHRERETCALSFNINNFWYYNLYVCMYICSHLRYDYLHKDIPWVSSAEEKNLFATRFAPSQCAKYSSMTSCSHGLAKLTRLFLTRMQSFVGAMKTNRKTFGNKIFCSVWYHFEVHPAI